MESLKPEALRKAKYYRKHRQAVQGKYQLAQQFTAHLETLEQHLEPFSEVPRAYDVLNRLLPELRKKINERAEKFETKNDVLAIATLIEAALKENETPREAKAMFGKHQVTMSHRGKATAQDSGKNESFTSTSSGRSKDNQGRPKDDQGKSKSFQGKSKGSRGTGDGKAAGKNESKPFACYNCDEAEHMARTYPKPCKDADKALGKDKGQ